LKLLEIYVGFHSPTFRNHEGQIDPRCWFGHCEVWGYTRDDTWIFIDPQGTGTQIRITHHYEEVLDNLEIRFQLCKSILKMPGNDPHFRFPFPWILTCATICGHLVGHRALFPWTLHRRLLRNGAEVIHVKHPDQENQRGGPVT
jgi:hypothetical protein